MTDPASELRLVAIAPQFDTYSGDYRLTAHLHLLGTRRRPEEKFVVELRPSELASLGKTRTRVLRETGHLLRFDKPAKGSLRAAWDAYVGKLLVEGHNRNN